MITVSFVFFSIFLLVLFLLNYCSVHEYLCNIISTNFSSVSSSHGLQFFTNCPSVQGCSLSRTGCSSVGPAWDHKSCQQTSSSMGSFLSPWVHRSCQESAPAQASHRVTASFRHTSTLVWGPFHELQVDIWSTMDLHGLQVDSLPHHGLHDGLQGKISASVTEAPPPPPSSLTLVSAEWSLSHSLTPLSRLLFHSRFFPFSNVLSQRHCRYH